MRLRAAISALLLGVSASACAGTGEVAETPSSRSQGTERIAYGEHRDQWVDLTVPTRASGAAVVLLHGGFWMSTFGADLMEPLVVSLADQGWIVANVEYRRVGRGGGVPETLDDVAAALDALAGHPSVDSERIALVGHSAGGQLALWLAGRTDAEVAPCGVVGQAAVADLTQAWVLRLGGDAVERFVGGSPRSATSGFDLADPARRPVPSAPVLLVHGRDDDIVPLTFSRDAVDLIDEGGGKAELATVDGDHFTLIEPDEPGWEIVVAWLAEHC